MPRSKGWNDPEDTRSGEPTAVSDVLRGLLAQRPFARGARVGLLAKAWADVVGERLAGETRPTRLEAGTLVVEATSGPWGSQAKFLAEEIRVRANRALRTEEVQRVHVVVSGVRPDAPKPL